jgi:DNA-binding IclR family transcriptional regulator
MTHKADNRLVLTRRQAECLLVLQNPRFTRSRIAIEAKLSIKQTEAALRELEKLGLAQQHDDSRLWLATPQSKTCSFETIPDRVERRSQPAGGGAPRLPVRSDRVHAVLQTIADAGALRIRDVSTLTRIAQPSINALMQYLKRKQLVAKTGPAFDSPYSLTDQGRVVLDEMTLRHAA